MHWELVVALLVAVPVVLFPVALIWYLNIGGVFAALKQTTGERVTGKDVRVFANDK